MVGPVTGSDHRGRDRALAGGRFYTHLLHHDGSFAPVEACILRADPESCLVFTDLLECGFRPATHPAFGYTAAVTMTPELGGTRVTVRMQYAHPAARQLHEDAGFHESWGIAASQLGALADSLRSEDGRASSTWR